MSWNSTIGRSEVAASSLGPVLRIRCELLILRMRIEELARRLPVDLLGEAPGRGQIQLRLWGLVALGGDEPAMRRQVLRVQRVYRLSSEYLHSRRAGLVPPPTELRGWEEDVTALESAAHRLIGSQG